MTYPITELYAWIVDDPSGVHGIIGWKMGPNDVQCASSRLHVMEKMKPEAVKLAEASGMPVQLVRFVLAEVIDEVGTR